MVLTYLLAVLAFLWFADELLTILDVQKFGINREENPFIRKLLEKGNGQLTLFKIFSFIVLVGIILFTNSINQLFALGLTVVIVSLYAIVVVRNFEVYKD